MDKIKIFRKVVQAFFLFLSSYLFFKTSYPLNLKIPVDLFFRLDVTSFLLTFIKRGEITNFIPALLVILFTIIFGRFFCGWICPLGTVFDLIKFKKKDFKKNIFLKSKYILTLFLFLILFFNIQFIWFFAPITVYNSALVLIIKNKIPHIFLSFILLNIFLSQRFFCKFICPTGAITGIFSKFRALNRYVNKECNECMECYKECPVNAIDANPLQCLKEECILCFNCQGICPTKAVSFKFKIKD